MGVYTQSVSTNWGIQRNLRKCSEDAVARTEETGGSALEDGHALALQTTRMTIQDAATEFLANKRVAVTGVSRKPQTHAANAVYRRLRQLGYEVFAVNPNADQLEGDQCFHDLKSIPGGVEAVVIGTGPQHALATMRECADLRIRQVWMHRSFAAGSVSDEAVAWGREHGIRVINGGCPLMFKPTADAAHMVMRLLLRLAGKIPRHVS